MMDLSFSNELIKNYFEGSDDYIPVTELIYVHEHPLIKGSFLVELEHTINRTTEELLRTNTKGVVLDKFIDATIKLGAELNDISKENAPNILMHLRTVYQLCNLILG